MRRMEGGKDIERVIEYHKKVERGGTKCRRKGTVQIE